MKERPILMNGEMVRAILDGRKTQTRRPVRPQPPGAVTECLTADDGSGDVKFFSRTEPRGVFRLARTNWLSCPYGKPGDLLYVRETWQAPFLSEEVKPSEMPPNTVVRYRAGGIPYSGWRPSIHMPKWAARIWLEIVDVRVETLQQIRCHGGVKEGFFCYHASYECAVDSFREVWDATYADKGLGWEADPWVWVVEFVVVER